MPTVSTDANQTYRSSQRMSPTTPRPKKCSASKQSCLIQVIQFNLSRSFGGELITGTCHRSPDPISNADE